MLTERTLRRREQARRSAAQRRRQRGVTLIELLVVLLIIGLIAVFAVPQVMNYVSGARQDAAAVQISRLGGILDLYRLDVGAYPSTDDGLEALLDQPGGAERWNGPYLKNDDALTDPWGRPWEYQAPGQSGDYDLWSYGADGTEGGDGEDADVTSW